MKSPIQRLIWDRKVGMLKRQPRRPRGQSPLVYAFSFPDGVHVVARGETDQRGVTHYELIAKFRLEERGQLRSFVGAEFFRSQP